jgi:hypothetical protein
MPADAANPMSARTIVKMTLNPAEISCIQAIQHLILAEKYNRKTGQKAPDGAILTDEVIMGHQYLSEVFMVPPRLPGKPSEVDVDQCHVILVKLNRPPQPKIQAL